MKKLAGCALGMMVLCLSATAWAESRTVTGEQEIATDTALDYLQVGTEDTAGTLNITGGTVTATGGVTYSDFRGKDGLSAGVRIMNGTITVSNATLETVNGAAPNAKTGIYVDAPEGCTATLIVNDGGIVTSAHYPGIGAIKGTTGTLIVNQGGTFNSTAEAFYLGGNGYGYAQLNGGTMNVSKIHIGRDYENQSLINDNTPGGDCEGYFSMSSGTLNVAGYAIIGRNNTAASTHTNIGSFSMTGGVATIGGAFSLGAYTGTQAGVSPDKVLGIAHIGGNAQLVVKSHFNLGNGEGTSTGINANLGSAVFDVSGNAKVLTGAVVDGENVTAQAVYMGIGKYSTLNLYDGSFTAYGTSGVTNAGTINVLGGNFATGAGVTFTNQGVVNYTSGVVDATINGGKVNLKSATLAPDTLKLANATLSATVGDSTIQGDYEITAGNTLNISGGNLDITGSLTNNGTLTFVGGLKGFGTLDVTGTYTGTGAATLGVSGVALFGAADNIPLMTCEVSNLTPDDLTECDTTKVPVTASLKTDAKKNDITLGKKVSALDSIMGWSEIKPDEKAGDSHVLVTLELTDNNDPEAFLTKFNEDLQVGGETLVTAAYVEGSTSLVTMLLSPELMEAEIFAWNFNGYGGVSLSAVDSKYVPEPATWALMVLGAFGLVCLRKHRF